MTKQRSNLSAQRGFALVYMAGVLTLLLLATGLAVDSGRAYVLKAQLTKAVDGAALGAARALNSGNPRGAAAQIFRANFPVGYMGTTAATDPATDPNFFKSVANAVTGVNVVTVTADATLPTTFMRLANFMEVKVTSSGEATRRMVDMSVVLDVSGSIGWRWPAVRDATKAFINAFDGNNDRIALLTFGNNANILNAMPSSRGFNKSSVIANVPTTLPGGSTNMVEGIYRGWDQLRSVPAGSQSGLRIIVLFTDGASNGVPGKYDAYPAQPTTTRTYDFPKFAPDPDNQTWNNPQINGLYNTYNGSSVPLGPPNNPNATINCSGTPCGFAYAPSLGTAPSIPSMPLGNISWHTGAVSGGMPTFFPLQSSTLTVQGFPQNVKRGLHNKDMVVPGAPAGQTGVGRYPADVFNINNSARNLVEIIANEARAETTGDYRIRIYTIGMGELVTYLLGTLGEPSSDVLKRMANDRTSLDFNAGQLEGKFYFAASPDDVSAAFEGIQNQILRLSK
jgi:Flp pilus assembly protein TadG